MELLKYLQNLEKEYEKELTDILLEHLWKKYGPVKNVENRTTNLGIPYSIVERGRPE